MNARSRRRLPRTWVQRAVTVRSPPSASSQRSDWSNAEKPLATSARSRLARAEPSDVSPGEPSALGSTPNSITLRVRRPSSDIEVPVSANTNPSAASRCSGWTTGPLTAARRNRLSRRASASVSLRNRSSSLVTTSIGWTLVVPLARGHMRSSWPVHPSPTPKSGAQTTARPPPALPSSRPSPKSGAQTTARPPPALPGSRPFPNCKGSSASHRGFGPIGWSDAAGTMWSWNAT